MAREYGRLPLAFEPNVGQLDARARYVARGAGYTLFLTKRAALLSLATGKHGKRGASVSLGFAGASPRAALSARSRASGTVNYLIGRDRSRWHTNVPTYGRVRYEHLWPGVDAAFYGRQGRLEYDFDVAPGADARRIRLAVSGARRLRVDRSGALVIALQGRSVRQLAPRAYQVVNGRRQTVASRYVVRGHEVAIALGAYDHGRPLTIDPTLAYATYLGGTDRDYGGAIAVDSSGAAYVTGNTGSTDFPATSGAYQTENNGAASANTVAYVAKLAPDGKSLAYCTYLGGSDGSQNGGIAVDSSGAAYVTGRTRSSDFPTTADAYQTSYAGGFTDAYVAKLAPDGKSLAYSSYLGGSDEDGGSGIALDPSGAAYVIGRTVSAEFPTTADAYQTTYGGHSSYDAFVTKVAPDGKSLAYSTYLGGSSHDDGEGIAVDSSGDAYVTGNTISSDFPTTAGAYQTTPGGNSRYDAYAAKLAPDGNSLTYSTYIGGSDNDFGIGLALDASGDAYVIGTTSSTDFPTTAGAYQTKNNGGDDVFVTKLAPDGKSLGYSTYLGGSSYDFEGGIGVDSTGVAHVAGEADSSDFPTTPDAYQSDYAGGDGDGFVARLSADGRSLLYSTFLGGPDYDAAYALALDSHGDEYIAGESDGSGSPTTAGAYQTSYAGGDSDAWLAKLTSRPVATTDAASNVARSAAALRGSVNPNGLATDYRFDYGPTASYGSSTTPASAGSDSSDHPESAHVAGLAPGATYHFRIVATSSWGTVYGADQVFTTRKPPPAPKPPSARTGPAKKVKPTSARVTGTVDPNGHATSYRVDFGTTAKYGSSTATESAGSGSSSRPVSAALESLEPGTLYHYRLVATSAGGTVSGGDRTFRTRSKHRHHRRHSCVDRNQSAHAGRRCRNIETGR